MILVKWNSFYIYFNCKILIVTSSLFASFDKSLLSLFVELLLYVLQGHKHYNVPAAETHEVGGKSFVESSKAFVFDDVADDSKQTSRLAWSSVHHSCFENINWGANNNCVES